eukprot:5465122-Lingulodinium_polyedra.AAC.1
MPLLLQLLTVHGACVAGACDGGLSHHATDTCACQSARRAHPPAGAGGQQMAGLELEVDVEMAMPASAAARGARAADLP